MREQLFEVIQCDPEGATYELTLKGTSSAPVTIRTDNAEVVTDLVLEHVHFHYKKIIHEKVKSLMHDPMYIGFIDELVTPFGKIEFRSSKCGVVCYEILVDGEREYTCAFYHTALAEYVHQLYMLVNTNVSAQIRHLIEWL